MFLLYSVWFLDISDRAMKHVRVKAPLTLLYSMYSVYFMLYLYSTDVPFSFFLFKKHFSKCFTVEANILEFSLKNGAVFCSSLALCLLHISSRLLTQTGSEAPLMGYFFDSPLFSVACLCQVSQWRFDLMWVSCGAQCIWWGQNKLSAPTTCMSNKTPG